MEDSSELAGRLGVCRGHSRPAPVAQALPISKLSRLAPATRAALKIQQITTCTQLLDAAADQEKRAALALRARIDPSVLTALVQRADMARVNGIGVVFGLMLERLDIRDVPTLAARDPVALHAELRSLNQQERMARRSPTPEEVADWIGQAKALRPLVTY